MQAAFGSIALTGDGAREWAGPITYSGGAAIQTARPVRAASARQFSRKNWQEDISFQVQREHADIEACEVYKFQHKQLLAAAGNQTLTISGPVEARYLNAVLKSVRVASIGVRSIIDYTFAGGIAS